ALVVMDGFHHPLKNRVQQLPRLLGIAVGEELHRALEVGEEHGDLLALAFEGRLGGEDSFGEMLRHVRRRRGKSRYWCGLSSQRLPAGSTELPAWRYGGPTRRAGGVEPCATFLAEADAGAIVEPALRAKH